MTAPLKVHYWDGLVTKYGGKGNTACGIHLEGTDLPTAHWIRRVTCINCLRAIKKMGETYNHKYAAEPPS